MSENSARDAQDWGVFMRTGLYGSPELGQPRDRGSSYPVQVYFTVPARNSRFYAVPVLGYVARVLLLIPHILVLSLLSLIVGMLQLVLWIPVLVLGRYPRWGYSMVGGYLRWNTRVQAFFLGLTDQFPPFQLRE